MTQCGATLVDERRAKNEKQPEILQNLMVFAHLLIHFFRHALSLANASCARYVLGHCVLLSGNTTMDENLKRKSPRRLLQEFVSEGGEDK